jgi:SAM-dependent methyltransferase
MTFLDPYGCVGGLRNLPQYALRLQLESAMIRKALATVQTPLEAGLDFGCGYGRLTCVLGEFCKTVHGVDPDILQGALSEKASTAGKLYDGVFPNIDFQVMTDKIPLADRSVDLSFTCTVLQHFGEGQPTAERATLRFWAGELMRVTKKHILCIEYTPELESFFPGWDCVYKVPRVLGHSLGEPEQPIATEPGITGYVYLFSK